MKTLDRITSWTQRNLKWLLPFVIIMPFVLWIWNKNIDAIGHWLWLAWHGQKGFEIEAAIMVVLVSILVGIILWMLVESYRKDKDL